MNQKELRAYLYDHVEGLEEANAQEETFDAAFLLREWAATTSNYPGDPSLALPVRWPGHDLIEALLDFRGGVACGGASVVYAAALSACGIPATQYYYGARVFENWGQFSHATTLFASPRDSKILYNLDAYLCYHFVDQDGALIPLIRMIRLIREKQYSKISRVDGVAIRPAVCMVDGKEPAATRFPNGLPPGERHGDRVVYHGMHVSMSNFLLSRSRWLLFCKLFGDMPMDDILLEFMLLHPRIAKRFGSLRQELYDVFFH